MYGDSVHVHITTAAKLVRTTSFPYINQNHPITFRKLTQKILAQPFLPINSENDLNLPTLL